MTGLLLSVAVLATGQGGEPTAKFPPGRRPIDHWMAELKKPDQPSRFTAVRALGSYPDEANVAVPALIGALKDRQVPLREIAAESLARIGPPAAAAVPALIEAYKDRSNTSKLRWRAIQALDTIDKAEAVPFLIEVLQTDPDQQVTTLFALGHYGAEAKAAVPWIIETFQNLQQPAVKAPAIIALRQIGPAAVPGLRQALEDDRPLVRIYSASVLAALEPKEAEGATRVIAAALGEQDPRLRQHAAALLLALEPGPAVLAVLRDVLLRDPGQCGRAALALGAMGPAAESAAPALLHLLATQKPAFVLVYQDALVKIGPGIVPLLRQAIRDERPRLRTEAAWCLYRIDRQAPEVLPALIEAVRGKDRELAKRAVAALSEMGPGAGPAVPALIEALACATCRQGVLHTLGKIGPGAREAVPALLERLKEPEYLHLTIGALGGIGPDARPAIPELARIARFPQTPNATVAAHALGRIGPAALPALLEMFRDKDPSVRSWALSAIGQIGPEAKEAVPALTRALKDKDSGHLVAYTLSRMGPAAQPAVSAMLEMLDANPRFYYQPVSQALRAIGPAAAQDAVPVLVRMLANENPYYGEAAAATLAHLGPDAVAELCKALKDPNPVLRERAAKGLMSGGSRTRAAVPALCEVLKDPNEKREVLNSAVNAVAVLCRSPDPPAPDLGDALKAAVPSLVAMLKTESSAHRSGAVYGLGKIGPRAREAVPALKEALKDPDVTFRMMVAEALWQVEGESASVMPVLLAILKDGPEWLHQRAAELLARMGPPARAALPALLGVLRRVPDAKVKAAVWQAVKSIDPRTAFLNGID